jgi:hypothetical protein
MSYKPRERNRELRLLGLLLSRDGLVAFSDTELIVKEIILVFGFIPCMGRQLTRLLHETKSDFGHVLIPRFKLLL